MLAYVRIRTCKSYNNTPNNKNLEKLPKSKFKRDLKKKKIFSNFCSFFRQEIFFLLFVFDKRSKLNYDNQNE
jgi:hypothetical protein